MQQNKPHKKTTQHHYCHNCKQHQNTQKLIYSITYNNWLCPTCYKHQFKPTPMHPTQPDLAYNNQKK